MVEFADIEATRNGLGSAGPLAQSVLSGNSMTAFQSLSSEAVKCLSTARPSRPVVGQMIFETDTQLSYFWNGTAWVNAASPPNGAAGGDLTGTYPNPTITNITNAPVHNSNTSLSFRIGGTQRMAVDSSGRLLTGNQPAFSVQKNNGNVGGNSVIVWNSVIYNNGGGYNASNGYFTAPVAGTYLFSIYGMGEWGTQYWRIDTYKNGSIYKQAYAGWYGTTGYNHASLTFPVPMAAGDYIYVVSGSVTMYGTYQYNGFTGYLLG